MAAPTHGYRLLELIGEVPPAWEEDPSFADAYERQVRFASYSRKLILRPISGGGWYLKMLYTWPQLRQGGSGWTTPKHWNRERYWISSYPEENVFTWPGLYEAMYDVDTWVDEKLLGEGVR